MTLNDWLTILAIFLGPIVAVSVTLFFDYRRNQRSRHMSIFNTLMRTRRTPIAPEHVGALNLVEIEFYKNPSIVTALKNLFSHFGTEHARNADERVGNDMSLEEVARRNDAFSLRLFEERQRLLAKLLHAMAKKLGFNLEQLEIFEGGYTPQGWSNDQLEERALRKMLSETFEGKRCLQVQLVEKMNNQPTLKRVS